MNCLEVAFHEAGHAVAGILYGHPIDTISIIPDSDRNSAGHVMSIYGGIIDNVCIDECLEMELLRQLARVSYAGFSAQCLFNAKADPWGSESDDRQASVLAERLSLSMDPQRWLRRQQRAARSLMIGNRAAVVAVANAVAKKKSLDPAKARLIVKKLSPNVPDEIDYPNMSGEFWDLEAVSQHYGVSIATLNRWRRERRGPKALIVGRYVRYYVRRAAAGSPVPFVVEEWE